MRTWKFDKDLIRNALAKIIACDELSIRFVEGEGFKNFLNVFCPLFKLPSRWTVSRDIFNIFVKERIKLKSLLKTNSSKVCLTTDSWTSVQRINYMCITTHFINNEWKLNKKILAFMFVSSHQGEYIAKALENSLLEWGLKTIFTVTLDNAASNDSAMSFKKNY